MFWRPAQDWRATRAYWFTSKSLMQVEMSKLATRAIYDCFNFVPGLVIAANDRDDKHW